MPVKRKRGKNIGRKYKFDSLRPTINVVSPSSSPSSSPSVIHKRKKHCRQGSRPISHDILKQMQEDNIPSSESNRRNIRHAIYFQYTTILDSPPKRHWRGK